jgi:MoxR-like ATPase
VQSLSSLIESNVTKVFRGKNEVVRQAILCLLAEGHLLIEDIPGVGKTTLALTLARSLDLSFQRIQFTSDLLPSDILGVSIFNSKTNVFEYKRGPLFHHVILADEINRSTPKTQSALLEAMNEYQVTMDNETHLLPQPFFVIATQNPYEHYGTYPLPESQLDRFLIRISIGYPDQKNEKEILREALDIRAIEHLSAVMKKEQLAASIQEVKKVKVDEVLDDYILNIVQQTRQSPFLELGSSPRGSLALRRLAQAQAYYEGRDYMIPDDIKKNAVPALAHRVILRALTDNGSESKTVEKIIREILNRINVPV